MASFTRADEVRYRAPRAALIVVDVQNDFCHPHGSLPSQYDFDLSHVDAAIPRLQTTIIGARQAGIPVVFVQTTHDPSTDSAAWLARLGSGAGSERAAVTCRTGTWGSEFFAVRPEPGDVIIEKHRFSAFVGTNLSIVLRSIGADSLLFAGVATEVCVESSLRDGLFNDFYVSLVEDCSASYSAEAHSASVAVVRQHFGSVTSSEELLSLWQQAPVGVDAR